MPNRVVVFDTSCLLCSRFIQVLLNNDRGLLYYTGFESLFARENLPSDLIRTPETVVFIEDGIINLKSEAVFAILRYLPARFRWLRIFRILPKSWLNLIYDWIARNRYGWFGLSRECFLPAAEFKSRFLA